MADKKISQLTDGTSFQSGDEAVVNRSGTNYKVDPTQFGDSIDVTGTVTADGLTVTSDGTFTNPNGVTLNLERDDTFLEDGNFISGLRFGHNDTNGTPPHGTGIKVTADSTFGAMFLDILSGSRDAWDGSNKAIRVSDSQTSFYQPVVFNEDGGDNDFRVESDTVTHALFVEGSSGNVGIGTSSPAELLHLGGGTNKQIRIDSSKNPGYVGAFNDSFNLAVNRRTVDGSIINADRSAAFISINGLNGGSNVTFFTANANNTSPTEAMRITSSGNVGIGTTSPGAELEVNGDIIADGIYLGGTAAANLLDDYEEGTWTPTYEAMTTDFSAITYDSLTAGRYTKIGNKVFIEGVIRTDSVTIGSAAGLVYIQGLPFTVNGTNPNAAVLISVAAAFAGDMPSSGQCVNGTNGIELRYRTVANGATSPNDPADFDTGANTNLLAFSAHYTV